MTGLDLDPELERKRIAAMVNLRDGIRKTREGVDDAGIVAVCKVIEEYAESAIAWGEAWLRDTDSILMKARYAAAETCLQMLSGGLKRELESRQRKEG